MNKIDFSDDSVFLELEDRAIDGVLDYEDFPPEEYKYFSKLAKLGYLNRHKGWSAEICEEKQRTSHRRLRKRSESPRRIGCPNVRYDGILAAHRKDQRG